MSFYKTYSPLFGKETSSLSIDLIKQYTLSAGDTANYIALKVHQQVAEATGYSIGAALFGSNLAYGGSASGSKSYIYQKDKGFIAMGYDDFLDFYTALNKTFTYINNLKQNRGSKQNSVVTYQFKDIVFGGEYIPSQAFPVKYYVQIGEAVFTMDEANFLEIAQTIRNMKLIWDQIPKVN